MTSSNTFKKFISIGAAALLAIGGSLVSTEAAHATASSNINGLSVYRLSSATRGASSTYTVTAGSSERLSSFVYDEAFPALTGGGALSVVFTLPAGVTIPYNNSLSVVTATSSYSSTAGASTTSPYTTYTYNLAADNNRISTNLRASLQLQGLSTGQSLTVTAVVTLAGTAITPTGSPTGTSSGFGMGDTVRGTGGLLTSSGDSYTAIAGDFAVTPQVSYMNNCIWSGSSTVTSGDVYQTVWSNGSGPAITSSYASSSYYASTTQNLTGTYASGSTSFTVPNPAPEVLSINPSAIITNLQPGDAIAPTFKVVKQGATTDLLEPCTRDEALPAVTAAATSSPTSVTLAITPPTTAAHYAGWSNFALYACVSSITNCGQRSTFGPPSASFGYMGMLQASATSVTIDAQHMNSFSIGMGQTVPRWDPAVEYKYVLIYMPNQGTNFQGVTAASALFSATAPVSNSNSNSGSNSNSVVAPSAPAPVWQAPLLNSVVTVGKNLATAGGKLNLKDGDFSGLKTVTVAGLAVLFTVDSKGSVNIPVPAGKVGTADLTLTFDSGTITIQDGIKYVAPTLVSSVAERQVAIAAGSKKITEAVADQVRQAAFANMANTSIQCVGYSASNSAAAKAAAKASAAALCALAVKANPALTASPITVLVDKAKARKAGVGIKVYKQN